MMKVAIQNGVPRTTSVELQSIASHLYYALLHHRHGRGERGGGGRGEKVLPKNSVPATSNEIVPSPHMTEPTKVVRMGKEYFRILFISILLYILL